MSKQTKIIIGVIAGILVLCLAICVVGGLLTTILGRNIAANANADPEKAAQTASEIADFTPPAGYQPVTGLNILGYTIVVYDNTSEASDVMILMQMPGLTEIDEATIRQMQQAMERQSGQRMNNMQVIETRDLTIRDKPARVIIQEGTYSDNSAPVRQAMVAFQGKGGVAMLMLAAPTDTWDQASIDRMVESIR